MIKISILAASIIALAIATASAQNQYMKAAPSSEPGGASAPTKNAKKAPATTTKCQTPGASKPATC
jgi:hypothetical protein